MIRIDIRATEVPGGNRKRRRNNKAQQKTRKISILKVYNVILTFRCCTQHPQRMNNLYYNYLVYISCNIPLYINHLVI